jgi:hypothetical protein
MLFIMRYLCKIKTTSEVWRHRVKSENTIGGEAQMGDLEKFEKNAKEKFDATVKTVTETVKSAPGKVIGIIVLVLIVINTFWNLWDNGNKISTELQAVKADVATLVTRLDELEKSTAGAVDLENVKADIESAKATVKADIDSIAKANENFETKLNAVIKAEEAKQETLLKEAEDHRTYIEELKGLLAGESGQ